MDRWELAVGLARRQHGLAATRQLAELGYSGGSIRRMVAGGVLEPVRKSVYRLCGARPTWESVALSAVLAAGEGAVLSHRSAGILWGLVDRHERTGALELTVVVPGRPRTAGVVAHRHRLEPAETTRYRQIPVTTVERTLLDLAESNDSTGLGRLIDDALRRRMTSVSLLVAELERHAGAGRRRVRSMQVALADRGAGYEPGANDWELDLDGQWERMGLPGAERQYRIRVAGGIEFRPDRAILDARVTVDWNGWDPHGYRSSFDADSRRRALLSSAGWHPLDFTSRSSPELICRTVLAVYEERVRLLASPPREPHLGHSEA